MQKQYRTVFKSYKPNTSATKPILLISVGQPYHEGEKLKSAIDLLNRSGFDNCTIMVACTLQRHNLLNKYDMEKAYQIAYEHGTSWIKRNQKYLCQLNIPYTIKRWDNHTINNSDYNYYRNIFLKDLTEDIHLRDSIDQTVQQYFQRQDIKYYDNLYINCRNYVIEECPVLMPLWASQGYDYILYPNKKMTPAMKATYNKYVKEIFPNKSIWVPLRYRKKLIAHAPYDLAIIE